MNTKETSFLTFKRQTSLQGLLKSVHLAFTGLILVVLSLVSFQTKAQSSSPDVLVRELSKGGLVVFMRHGDTGSAGADRQQAVMGDCSTQRNLNDSGRAELAAMAAAIKTLRVPVGKVLASEFCRGWQTADILFGAKAYTITSKLSVPASYPGVSSSDTELNNTNLKVMLAEKPSAGSNTFLVSHGVNVLLATAYHPGIQGEAVVFRPDGKGGYSLLGSVLPDDWIRLAAARSSK